jgi:hypothetical protein
VTTIATTAGRSSLQAAADALTAGGGADTPESSWEALYQTATGTGTSVGGATVPAWPYSATPLIPAGETGGDGPGVGWRDGSLPIIVWITDAPGHGSNLFAYSYSFTGTASATDAIAAINTMGARVVGICSSAATAEGRLDQLQAVNGTGAVVTPSAWDDGGRPAGCASTQCCTGINGAGEAPTAGLCPLDFLISATGSGVSAAVLSGVGLLTRGMPIDITAVVVDDPSDPVDAVAAFVARVAPNTTAGAPACTSGLVTLDQDADTVVDTFTDVLPGTPVCFDVVPRRNETVAPTAAPQIYGATIRIHGDHITVLDERRIWFVVPPELTETP